ncbi:MAG: hypothetical protein WDM76_05025 [Limisphaerales bacterium]
MVPRRAWVWTAQGRRISPVFFLTNAAVQTHAFDTSSVVVLPNLNLTGTNGGQTITAWVYNEDPGGGQNPYTGIVFCRGGSTAAGLICSSDGTNWVINGLVTVLISIQA